jgi:hypothetical protein
MYKDIYNIIFEKIKEIVEKLLDKRGKVIVYEIKKKFIEKIILIMKNVMESKKEKK